MTLSYQRHRLFLTQLILVVAIFVSLSITKTNNNNNNNNSFVYGYASWLKCFIEFDPDEIVMHQPMVPPEDARVKAMIEIQPYTYNPDNSDNDSDESTKSAGSKVVGSRRTRHTGKSSSSSSSSSGDGNDDETWISAEEYSLIQVSSNNSTTTQQLLKVRLRVPPSLRYQDVQWVVEATPVSSSSTTTGDDLSLLTTARFIDLGVMCDGNRAFSRKHHEHVVLQIDDDGTEDIALQGAWAAGYEAVTLTPKMILKRQGTSQEQQQQQQSTSSTTTGEEL